MINFLISNWSIIVFIIAAIGVIAYGIYTFSNKPTDEQIRNLKEWLLYAVAAAEKEFGSGTGELKLRSVYNQFIEKFPYLSNAISFEKFSDIVEQVLVVFRKLMEDNNSIEYYIKNKENK